MQRQLGINVGCIAGMPQPEQLDLIHKTGFETFFTGCQTDTVIGTLKEKADALGMTFETIHAPFRGINNMWIPGMDYIDVYRGMKHSVDLAAKHGVPAVVMHVSGGWNPPGISDLGLQRFDELVFYAADRGVSTDVLFYTAKKIAMHELGLNKKDRIVITGGDTTGHSGNTNLIKIEEI